MQGRGGRLRAFVRGVGNMIVVSDRVLTVTPGHGWFLSALHEMQGSLSFLSF